MIYENLGIYYKHSILILYMANDDKNFSAYLTANLEEFRGKWIILCDEHVIASGKDIKKLVSEAQKNAG
jgi:hypothetical protein